MTSQTYSFLDRPGDLEVGEILRDLPGRRRAVAARLEGEPLFAKLFPAENGGKRRADREDRRIRAAERRGLRVAKSRGRARVRDEAGVVWEAVLQDWTRARPDFSALDVGREAHPENDELAHELMRSWGDLHARGLDQRDPKLENILRDDQGALFVDLATVQPLGFAFGLGGWLRAGSLGLLFAQLDPSWWSQADDLLTSYVEGGGRPITTARVRTAAQAAWKGVRQDARKKRLRDCSDVEVRPLGAGRLLLARESSRAADLGRFLSAPENASPPEGISFLRPGSLSQAQRGWIDLWTLRRYGLPVAEPLALLENGVESSLVVGGTARSDLPDAERIALVEEARRRGRLRGVSATWENAPSLDARSGPCLGAWALAPRFFAPPFGDQVPAT